jgi:hypothetical protein
LKRLVGRNSNRTVQERSPDRLGIIVNVMAPIPKGLGIIPILITGSKGEHANLMPERGKLVYKIVRTGPYQIGYIGNNVGDSHAQALDKLRATTG